MQPPSISAEDLTARGAAALRAGDTASARALLAAAIRSDPSQPRAWLWLSGVVATPAEQRFCLERAAALDPQLAAARRGLSALADVSPRAPALLAPAAQASTPTSRAQQTAHPPPAPALAAPPDRYINPWLWIWLQPVPALRSAIRGRNNLETATLAMLGGVNAAFAWGATRGLGADAPPASLLLLVLLAGPPLGLAALMLSSVILRITGRWLGGHGGSGDLRAALAWAGAPLLLGLPLWIAQLILLPAPSFAGAATSGGQALLVAILGAGHVVLWGWAALLAILGVSSAHRVGPLRAVLTWLVAVASLLGAGALVLAGAALLIWLRQTKG